MNNNTSTDIFWFTRHGEYGFLSNFYRSPIDINKLTYLTVEHWYQSQKSNLLEEREMIRNLATPKEAKFAGYHIVLRHDWESIKEEIMLIGIREKFTQHQDLLGKLLKTYTKKLHEDSPWDKYWGFANGKGLDRLGKLLMQVREEFSN